MNKLLLIVSLVVSVLNLTAQDIPQNLSETEKIYGLSKVWKEADKNFVFFDQIPDVDWDKSYQEFLSVVTKTTSTYAYYKELQRFCSLLNDGHTRVVVPWQLREIHEVSPAINTELIGKKVYITDILDDAIAQQGLKKGMEIVEIDGLDIHDYAKKNIKPFVFYSTLQDRNVQIYNYHLLEGHKDEMVTLKTLHGTKAKTYRLKRTIKKKEAPKRIFEFEILPNNTGYLKINRFWGENIEAQFDELFPEIQKTASLIIDVSENQGGNSGYANYVLRHFVDRAFETSRWKTLMYMPAYASWGFSAQWQDNQGDIIKPMDATKRYNKKVVVLISEKTYSAGEDFVSAFLNTERGKVIGRVTAGTTGNPIGFALPGGGGFQICSKRDYLSTGKEFVGYGIKPHIKVKQSLDEKALVNKALDYLNI